MKRRFENGHQFDEIANSKHLRQKKYSISPQLTASRHLLTSWLKGSDTYSMGSLNVKYVYILDSNHLWKHNFHHCVKSLFYLKLNDADTQYSHSDLDLIRFNSGKTVQMSIFLLFSNCNLYLFVANNVTNLCLWSISGAFGIVCLLSIHHNG